MSDTRGPTDIPAARRKAHLLRSTSPNMKTSSLTLYIPGDVYSGKHFDCQD